MADKKLREIVERFDSVKILVVGDVMLDEFVWGQVSRISPEAPIPVVRVVSETAIPGGAGNVAANVSSLGANVHLTGIVGNDVEARILKKELKLRGVTGSGLIVDNGRPTILKRRIIADNQQVVRMDREETGKIHAGIIEKIVDYCRSIISGVDGIVISDYGKGVVAKLVVRELLKFGRERHLPIAVDPKTRHFDRYSRVTIITPNKREVEENRHVLIENKKMLVKAGRNLLRELGCSAVLITRGEEGMSLFEKDGSITHIPAVAREVYDVTGAGDTVTCVLTLSLSCGATMREAAVISNYAAAVVVGKRGTAAVTRDELIDMLERA